jgi:hypothetical protein
VPADIIVEIPGHDSIGPHLIGVMVRRVGSVFFDKPDGNQWNRSSECKMSRHDKAKMTWGISILSLLTTGTNCSSPVESAPEPKGSPSQVAANDALAASVKAEAALLARADALAVLKGSYEGAPKGEMGRGKRWHSAYLAGKVANKESLQMLEEIALVHETIVPAEVNVTGAQNAGAKNHAGCGSRTDFSVRAQAAVGIVGMLESGMKEAEDSVSRVLRDAEKEVARIAALELFIRGLLKEEHKRNLADRDIPTNFRRYTELEAEKLRTIPAVTLARRNSKKPKSILPPIMPEGFVRGGLQ